MLSCAGTGQSLVCARSASGAFLCRETHHASGIGWHSQRDCHIQSHRSHSGTTKSDTAHRARVDLEIHCERAHWAAGGTNAIQFAQSGWLVRRVLRSLNLLAQKRMRHRIWVSKQLSRNKGSSAQIRLVCWQINVNFTMLKWDANQIFSLFG